MSMNGPSPTKARQIVRCGATIPYRTAGHGPCVVLIPSLGRGSEDFDSLIAPLVSAGLRVILPEPRGIGGASPLDATDTLHDMAADIAAVIEAEAAAPAVVLGHAAGNWVARVLAQDRPELVRGVILAAAIVTDQPPQEVRAAISGSFDMSLTDAQRLENLARVYFAPESNAADWLGGWWPDVAAAQRRAATQTADKGWIRTAARHPVLYLGAEADVISPPPTETALRGTIGPQAEVVVIAGAGHALLPEQPAAVAAALIRWIAALPA